MKKYKKETLKNDLQFDIYYTGSQPLAYTSPHLGHLVQEDLELDDEEFKIDIERTYFHKTENCIVYELSNGDSIYIANKPIVVKDNENVNSLNDLFNSVINK